MTAQWTDWKNCGTGADGGTGNGGTQAWVDPTNIADGSSPTTYATCELNNSELSNILRATNFGFSTTDIPAFSDIVGVEIQIFGRSVEPDTEITEVRLRTSAGQVGSNLGGTSPSSFLNEDVDAAHFFGGGDGASPEAFVDLGVELDGNDIRDSDFGVDLDFTQDPSDNTTVSIRNVRIRVAYEEPPDPVPEEPDTSNVPGEIVAKALTYVEVDLQICQLTYGNAPCTAVLGSTTASPPGTGTDKCFNSLATCQDTDNIDLETVTLRFAVDRGYLPTDIDAIPIIKGVDVQPPIISLGEDLGRRASMEVTFMDVPHSDVGDGFDPYVTERSYDPYSQGTLFGKLRKRHPFVRGQNVRLYQGVLGQSLSEMVERHYVIDYFEGPNEDGEFTIVAKDVLKLLDGDRAQAPALSTGFLDSAIDDVTTSATLSPAGIGDTEYPASGYVNIGGNEVCSFSRSGDSLTITRAQLGTVASDHSAGDRVQLCIYKDAIDPAEWLYDLARLYAGINTQFLPVANWLNETQTWLQRVYTWIITEPTSVQKLFAEQIETAGLKVWWDEINQQVKLRVLRPVDENALVFSQDNFIANSLKITEQDNKRLTRVQVYFGQIDPTKSLSDPENWRSSALVKDDTLEANYGSPVIKTIYARGIAEGGRTTAERLAGIWLGRFTEPPRRFAFDLLRHGPVSAFLGTGYRLSSWQFQDALGAASNPPIEVTSVKPGDAILSVEAEESNFDFFDEVDLANRVIIIDASTTNFDLKTQHDLLFPELSPGASPAQTVTCIIQQGVTVGSVDTDDPAFSTGEFPVGIAVTVRNLGRIQGKGGDGGNALTNGGNPGEDGGTAMLVENAINLDNTNGEIYGGGGGGGAGQRSSEDSDRFGGGGGAGTIGGAAGENSENVPEEHPPFIVYPDDGSRDAGGQGGSGFSSPGAGGDGGAPGTAGEEGEGSSGGLGNGGAAGVAIDGDSNVSLVDADDMATANDGDVQGTKIN